MHDEVAVVEEHPLAVLNALTPQWTFAGRLQLALDLIDQAAQVRARRTGGDDEQVGDYEEVGNVQDGGVFTLFLDDGRNRFPGGCDGLIVGWDGRSSLIRLGSS